jgi:hypothetical protein
MSFMTWAVASLAEFDAWFLELSDRDQAAVMAYLGMLEERGPTLPHPYSSGIVGSKHGGMRELRVQRGGRPIRVLYAFDPTRTAIVILGGDKTGDDRWYEVNVPIADRRYDAHLASLRRTPAPRRRK